MEPSASVRPKPALPAYAETMHPATPAVLVVDAVGVIVGDDDAVGVGVVEGLDRGAKELVAEGVPVTVDEGLVEGDALIESEGVGVDEGVGVGVGDTDRHTTLRSWFEPLSATQMTPDAGSTATPSGALKEASGDHPLLNPIAPLPARVVTAADASSATARRTLPSVTMRRLLIASVAMLRGARKNAALPTGASTYAASTPLPAHVVTTPVATRIWRIAKLNFSTTNRYGSPGVKKCTATPSGPLNRALLPVPSKKPAVLLPATVETRMVSRVSARTR